MFHFSEHKLIFTICMSALFDCTVYTVYHNIDQPIKIPIIVKVPKKVYIYRFF